MEKKMNTDETLAIILSNVKSLASHFKIDKRRPSGDDPTAEQEESKQNEMLRGIAVAVDRIAAAKTFTAEQVDTMGQIVASLGKYMIKKDDEKHSELKLILEKFDQKLTEQTTAPQQSTVRHEFAVDFKNSKAVMTMILMGIVILFSVSGNIWQWVKNDDLRDNDLKYRRVLMMDGATAEDLTELQNVFDYNRNKDTVKWIRRQVEHFEHLVKERAEKLEQARLDAARARQLNTEAETLKKKK